MEMKRWIMMLVASMFMVATYGATTSQQLSLIPLPKSVEMGDGEFVFGKKLTVMVAPVAEELFADFSKEFMRLQG